MLEYISWVAKPFASLARWGSFEFRVARTVASASAERRTPVDARALRMFLYRTKFVSRFPEPRHRAELLEEVRAFASDDSLASWLFSELEAAVIRRSSNGDAIGSAAIAINGRLDEAIAIGGVEDEKRWADRLERMRGYRANAAREIAEQWPRMRAIVAALDGQTRERVLSDWQKNPPKYLADAPPAAHAWIADLAADLGLTSVADRFFDLAIEGGAHPAGFWVARQRLLDREDGSAAPDRDGFEHPLLRALEAEQASDATTALSLIKAWKPSNDYESVYRQAVLCRAAYGDRDYEGAIRFSATSRALGSTAATLWWARALMAREIFTSSELYKGDTADALDGLLAHRDAMRIAGHDTSEIVVAAATAARLLNDLERAVALTVESPAGEATAAEAEAPSVRLAAATMLAENGDVRLALEVLESGELTAGAESQIRALVAHHDGNAEDEAKWTTAAIDDSDDPEVKGRLAYRLAHLGVVHGFVEEQERLGNAEFANHLRLIAAVARGEENALETLRAEALGSAVLAVGLAEHYARLGDTGSELRVLEQAATRKADADLWLTIAARQFQEGRLASAKASLDAAVSAAAPKWGALPRVRALQIEVASALQDWPAAIAFAEALVRLRPDDKRAQWTLIACLYFGGEIQRAAEMWRSQAEPAPSTRQDVAVWLGICQAQPGFGSVAEWARLASDWADDEEIRRNIVGLMILPPQPETDPDEGDESEGPSGVSSPRGHSSHDSEDGKVRAAIIAAYFADFPEGEIRQFSVTLDDDSLLDQIRAAIGERPDTSAFDDALYSGSLPLGFSTAVHGGTYVESVISCATGVRFLGQADAAKVASTVVNGSHEVVVDTTALLAITKLPETIRVKVISGIGSLSTSDVQYRDAVQGLQTISRFGHAGPNIRRPRGPVARRVRGQEPGADRADAAAIMAEMRRYTRLPPDVDFDPSPIESDLSTEVWFGSVMAAGEARALWVDDRALGLIAAEVGVHSFTTLDLLASMRMAGRITEDEEREARAALLRERYFGVAFDVRTYSAAFLPTRAVASAIASIIERQPDGDANEILTFMMAGAGALSAQPFALEMWLSAATRWLRAVAPDREAIEKNLHLLARRVLDAVWLIQANFPFIDSGMTDGLDGDTTIDPLVEAIATRRNGLPSRDRSRSARELLDLVAGIDPDQRVRYTALALR